jgi:hypothetical protein
MTENEQYYDHEVTYSTTGHYGMLNLAPTEYNQTMTSEESEDSHLMVNPQLTTYLGKQPFWQSSFDEFFLESVVSLVVIYTAVRINHLLSPRG